MKNFVTLLCLALVTITANAGESWMREVFASGEAAYKSHKAGGGGVFSYQVLMLGERGISVSYGSATRSITTGVCRFSIDDAPYESCEFDKLSIANSKGIANRVATAKKFKFTGRICDFDPLCQFAIQGGVVEEFVWEFDEPLNKAFPEFKPYEVKK